MKEIYLLRHGEKDADGILTDRGMRAAEAMRPLLPPFARVISSGIDRADLTAGLLTGQEPEIDPRAAYATTSADVSKRIAALAQEHNISFLDAARIDNDAAVLEGVEHQAHALNELIDEALTSLPEDGQILIVSHDLTIVPAMMQRDMPPESIEPLGGFVVSLADGVTSVRHY